MSTAGTIRSQDEIMARLTGLNLETDFLAVRATTLIGYLDFEHALAFLKEGTTAAQWIHDSDPISDACEHLPFAIDKAIAHRGLSALRSVDHFQEWAWLSAEEDFDAALDAGYNFYGAPILQAIALAIGMADVWNRLRTPELDAMAAGQPCSDGCPGCL